MSDTRITSEALEFLKQLKLNNDRDWFADRKPRFKQLEAEMKAVFTAVMNRLKVHDQIERMKMFRIYRDIRFSNNKTPYKTCFSASYQRMGAAHRGGYYIHIEPGNSFLATGFWNPEKEDLLRIRKELELDATEFRAITQKKSFVKIWGPLVGDTLKTSPKGFDKTHENIDLIRYKQFTFKRSFTDDEVLSSHFIDMVDKSYQAIRPYFDYMSEVLTTNLNGESTLK